MDYVATYPTTYIRYHDIDMILNIGSDYTYLVSPKARSRVAGYFKLNTLPKLNYQTINGAICVEVKGYKLD